MSLYLAETDVVVDVFREHRRDIPSDASFLQVGTRCIVVDEKFVDGIDYAVAHIVFPLQIGCSDEYAHLVRVAVFLAVILAAPIVEDREAVQVDTFTLAALEDFQQATLAHRDVELAYSSAQYLRRTVVATLAPVIDEVVCRQTFRQEMVGDKLIQQIVLAGVVDATLCLWINVLLLKITRHISNGNVEGWLTQQAFPEAVGLSKVRIAVVAMLRRVEIVSVALIAVIVIPHGYNAPLVEVFVNLVAILVERVEQSHSMCQHGRNIVSLALLPLDVEEQSSERVVAGCHHSVHGVQDTVYHRDVAVAHVHRLIVDEEMSHAVLALMNGQASVQHVGHRYLSVLFDGEVVAVEDGIVASVDDAVVDDDLLDRVAFFLVAEAVPGWFLYQSFLTERLQIGVYGVVRGGEHRVVPSGCKKLPHGSLADVAHSCAMQQIQILTVFLWELLHVAHHRVRSEHVTI